MVNIGKKPPGPLPKPGDKVHIKGSTAGFVYVVCSPGTVHQGLNVWTVRVRAQNGTQESWVLLSNVTVIKLVDEEQPIAKPGADDEVTGT